jgi:hypothetical protein
MNLTLKQPLTKLLQVDLGNSHLADLLIDKRRPQ